MAPRKGSKGGKGGKQGGKRAAKRKARNTWDDEHTVKKSRGAASYSDEEEQEKTKPMKRESMFQQWKEKKIAKRQKERQFMSKTEQKKQLQLQQYETQRRRLANAAYGHKEAHETTPAAKSSDDEEDEEESDAEEEEEKPRGKRQSIFDQFVQTFQPAAMEEDEEEEYEEIEVDEDGNPIEPEEEEEEDEAEEEAESAVEEEEEEEEEEEQELVDDDDQDAPSAQDPYRQRYLLSEFSEADAKRVDTMPRKYVSVTSENVDGSQLAPSMLEEFNVSYRPGALEDSETPLSWMPSQFHVRGRLLSAWKAQECDPSSWRSTSPLEYALFRQFSAYRDVFFAGQTYDLTQPLRRVSAMHTLNHVLKSRDTIIRNNERLRKRQEPTEEQTMEDDDEKEYRDQGFARTTVLVLLPLRSAAYSFVQELLALLPSNMNSFHNKDRFDQEYGPSKGDDDEEEDDATDKEDLKEWQRVFSDGNNDDSFQIGLSLSRRGLKFYSDYTQSDFILASPLGLRQQLGDEVVDVAEQQSLSSAFLSSIEVCIVDSASLLLMQNVEHMRYVLQAINVKPKEAPNADFSRLREWNLSFLGAYFRQTIVYAHGVEPMLQNLLHTCCKNQSGLVKYVRNYDSGVGESTASITQIVPQVKQIFQRIDLQTTERLTAAYEVELRFEYFQKHIFTPLLDSPRKHVLIFVPSYFDYVRVRNLFHETMNAKLIRTVQCCEYTTSPQVSRARTSFFHGRCHVMLFTERFHFYHQYQMRGIHQLIFYGLPMMGEFYAEMLNMMDDASRQREGGESAASLSSVALFTRLDLLRLQRVVGQKRAQRMCQSNAKKATFLFC
ncbi:hypothetical protein Poli38472_010814 [Pythium oligandrum]|uniref:Digestive organ expansion factor n=1 Tax=Pythium oligandrum TaxID=41045 RepID=A0A8K1CF82_PYTOL|nr:hypothetical protein Poli38472_010814 [Pythium oligandrum]|eukprot:TMW61751.1 hypothetical protein Poli38472_010814 [Pythium oligandrum]